MEALGYDQVTLAAKIGVDPATVSRWFSKKTQPQDPSVRALARLPAALHASADWLLGIADAPTPPPIPNPVEAKALKELLNRLDAIVAEIAERLASFLPKDDDERR